MLLRATLLLECGENRNVNAVKNEKVFTTPPPVISIEEEKNSSFYIARIDDTMFYRTLEFGDLNIAVKDFELEIKTLLHNIQKANKNFEPI